MQKRFAKLMKSIANGTNFTANMTNSTANGTKSIAKSCNKQQKILNKELKKFTDSNRTHRTKSQIDGNVFDWSAHTLMC